MKDNVEEFIKVLSKAERNTEFVYGTLKWTCNYFHLDESKCSKGERR